MYTGCALLHTFSELLLHHTPHHFIVLQCVCNLVILIDEGAALRKTKTAHLNHIVGMLRVGVSER